MSQGTNESPDSFMVHAIRDLPATALQRRENPLLLVRAAGIEPAAPSFGVKYSIH